MLLLPSPNCQYQAATVPSGSVEPEPSNETATLVVPVRSGPAFAVGSWFGLVVLVVDEVEVDVVLGFDVDVDEVVEVDVVLGFDVDVVLVEEEVEVVELVVVVVLPPLAAQAGMVNATASSSADAARERLPPSTIILLLPLLRRCGFWPSDAVMDEQASCRGRRCCSWESPPHHAVAHLPPQAFPGPPLQRGFTDRTRIRQLGFPEQFARRTQLHVTGTQMLAYRRHRARLLHQLPEWVTHEVCRMPCAGSALAVAFGLDGRERGP